MDQSVETPEIALEHIRFQLDLLRLTTTPMKMAGYPAQALRPRADAAADEDLLEVEVDLRPEHRDGHTAEDAMHELTVAAAQLEALRR